MSKKTNEMTKQDEEIENAVTSLCMIFFGAGIVIASIIWFNLFYAPLQAELEKCQTQPICLEWNPVSGQCDCYYGDYCSVEPSPTTPAPAKQERECVEEANFIREKSFFFMKCEIVWDGDNYNGVKLEKKVFIDVEREDEWQIFDNNDFDWGRYCNEKQISQFVEDCYAERFWVLGNVVGCKIPEYKTDCICYSDDECAKQKEERHCVDYGCEDGNYYTIEEVNGWKVPVPTNIPIGCITLPEYCVCWSDQPCAAQGASQ